MPRTTIHALLLVTLLPSVRPAAARELVVDDFEDIGDWHGLEPEAGTVRDGAGAGRWRDTVAVTAVRKGFDPPLDVRGFSHLGFWLHSAAANGARLQLTLDSERPESEGWDYYTTALTLDWSGWRWIWLALDELSVARAPLGWDQVRAVGLHSAGWDHTPQADTDLVLDTMVFARSLVTDVRRRQGWEGEEFAYTWEIDLEEPDGEAVEVSLTCEAPEGLAAEVRPAQVALAPGGTASATARVVLPPAVLAEGPYRLRDVTFSASAGSCPSVSDMATSPTRPHMHKDCGGLRQQACSGRTSAP